MPSVTNGTFEKVLHQQHHLEVMQHLYIWREKKSGPLKLILHFNVLKNFRTCII